MESAANDVSAQQSALQYIGAIDHETASKKCILTAVHLSALQRDRNRHASFLHEWVEERLRDQRRRIQL